MNEKTKDILMTIGTATVTVLFTAAVSVFQEKLNLKAQQMFIPGKE